MAKSITTQNLHALIDSLLAAGTRVVGPTRVDRMLLFAPLGRGEDLDLSELPRRSAKETFFPVCEDILRYERHQGKTTVTDIDLGKLPETVLVGARPCDAAAPGILDAVFSWDYHDDFFLRRRHQTTVIGIACTSADDACFCCAVGLAPDARSGSDLFLTPLEGGGFGVDVLTGKGEALVTSHAALFTAPATAVPLPLAKPQPQRLDPGIVRQWLGENFESDFWHETAARCAGCGACAFLCPVCHCFDISDEGTEERGCRRRHWDACGFAKFTAHASGHNPRDVQPSRYRNRVMHKFLYYPDKFGQILCTGCGRCVRACPVGIDLVEILSGITGREAGGT